MGRLSHHRSSVPRAQKFARDDGAQVVAYCVGVLNQVEEKLKAVVMDRKLVDLSDHQKFEVWNDLKFLEFVSDVIDTKVWRGPELGFQKQNQILTCQQAVQH